MFKRKWVCFFICLCVFALLLISYKVLFDDGKLTRSDWLGFLGAYLGSLGTVFLGIVSLFQNQKLHVENKRIQEKAFLFEYHPDMILYSYSISEPFYYEDGSMNEFCFMSEAVQEKLDQNCYDPNVDECSGFRITLNFRNMNPKSYPRHIMFKDVFQIHTGVYSEIYKCSQHWLPLRKVNEDVFSVNVFCAYEIEEENPYVDEYSINECNDFLESIIEKQTAFQATIVVGDYQGLVEESHLDLLLDEKSLHDHTILATSPIKNAIKYYTERI